MKKEILKQLKADYEKLKIKPSADLWDRLDQKLDQTPEIPLKRSFQWWKYAAVVLLFISAGTFIYYNNYKAKFDSKQTDYIVKKTLEKTVNPINVDLEDQTLISNDQPVRENAVKIVNNNLEKFSSDPVLIPKKERSNEIQVAEHKEEQNIVQPENNIIKNERSANTIIPNPPLLAEVKKSKSNYINSDELLLGREFDKAREKASKDERKLGAFKFDNIVPNVGNVTVLGVTVYLESK
ncbi:hypothetical protein [Chryseobacterium lathyri]|uniref:Anti-sigma factor n=1 Tax=Chryseobacterium lathyri TaxID=395933 RepID=A0ABT9SN01_9FLAO|nr:hypothetical protein [Chryseobacterium lathyri]MDP9959860.1 hypothetical protein [Chryseobacterium lathyri]